MWYSNGTFHYMFKAEFVTLISLKVPSGWFLRLFLWQALFLLSASPCLCLLPVERCIIPSGGFPPSARPGQRRGIILGRKKTSRFSAFHTYHNACRGLTLPKPIFFVIPSIAKVHHDFFVILFYFTTYFLSYVYNLLEENAGIWVSTRGWGWGVGSGRGKNMYWWGGVGWHEKNILSTLLTLSWETGHERRGVCNWKHVSDTSLSQTWSGVNTILYESNGWPANFCTPYKMGPGAYWGLFWARHIK